MPRPRRFNGPRVPCTLGTAWAAPMRAAGSVPAFPTQEDAGFCVHTLRDQVRNRALPVVPRYRRNRAVTGFSVTDL
jgi:hypothetical protein